MIIHTCRTCKYAFPCKLGNEIECRRYPPQVIVVLMDDKQLKNIIAVPQSHFPHLVADEYWCGEYDKMIKLNS